MKRTWVIWQLMLATLVVLGILGYSWVEGKMGTTLDPYLRTELDQGQLKQVLALQKMIESRNPFIPLTRPVPTPKTTVKKKTDISKGIFTDSPSKIHLLGIVHGKHDPFAVIRLSDGKRIMVNPGAELANTGWKVKSIQESSVVLERLTTSGSTPKSSKQLILRFSSLPSS